MKLAILFPGQGAQSVGMLASLASEYPIIDETYREAGEALGFDLLRMVREGPAEQLNRTPNTQPALLAAGVGLWRALRIVTEGRIAGLAGHSLGEYTALVCAGSLDFADALRLVRARGTYMQEAVPEGEGAMAAILGLEDDVVRRLCRQVAGDNGVVEPVNYNAPGQVVIAGDAVTVQRAMDTFKAAGAKLTKRLPVSVPSHCTLMRPAARRLEVALNDMSVRAPRLQVLHNVDAMPRREPSAIRKVLVRQLYSPVLWVDTVRKLSAGTADIFLECGPGKTLSGLNRRIARDIKTVALQDGESLARARSMLEGTP